MFWPGIQVLGSKQVPCCSPYTQHFIHYYSFVPVSHSLFAGCLSYLEHSSSSPENHWLPSRFSSSATSFKKPFLILLAVSAIHYSVFILDKTCVYPLTCCTRLPNECKLHLISVFVSPGPTTAPDKMTLKTFISKTQIKLLWVYNIFS